MTDALQKYEVLSLDDPLARGRVLINPTGDPAHEGYWAEACAPVGADGHGLFVPPAVGSMVWIFFENGAPDAPVWFGGAFTQTLTTTPDPQNGDAPAPTLTLGGCTLTFLVNGLKISAPQVAVQADGKIALGSDGVSVDVDPGAGMHLEAGATVLVQSPTEIMLRGAPIQMEGWPLKFSPASGPETTMSQLQERIQALETLVATLTST